MLSLNTAHPQTAPSVGLRCLLFVLFATLSLTSAGAQTPSLVEFMSDGRVHRGLRLITLQNESIVMGRDGWLHAIESDATTPIRALRGRYEPLSAPEVRNQLRSEFGGGYEVVATQNFLVVQPRGRGRRWPDLFERCHRAFSEYMNRRGVLVREGRFPMVAVVFPDSASMYAEFARQDIDVSRVAGIYNNSSNRVMTHDGGRVASIASTVRHEAAHQSAFNSGVHSRINDTPQWITEGVGQMFEPAAMARPGIGSNPADRVHRESLLTLRRKYGRHHDAMREDIARLVRGDTMFGDPRRVRDAYALSWAMMFFLAERQPEKFADLLNYTAARPPFEAYSAGQRRLDFERIVAADLSSFAKQLGWFLDTL